VEQGVAHVAARDGLEVEEVVWVELGLSGVHPQHAGASAGADVPVGEEVTVEGAGLHVIVAGVVDTRRATRKATIILDDAHGLVVALRVRDPQRDRWVGRDRVPVAGEDVPEHPVTDQKTVGGERLHAGGALGQLERQRPDALHRLGVPDDGDAELGRQRIRALGRHEHRGGGVDAGDAEVLPAEPRPFDELQVFCDREAPHQTIFFHEDVARVRVGVGVAELAEGCKVDLALRHLGQNADVGVVPVGSIDLTDEHDCRARGSALGTAAASTSAPTLEHDAVRAAASRKRRGGCQQTPASARPQTPARSMP
jgi:hypothetical protein